MDYKELKLSDSDLARLLARQLWQGYDSGGISLGRSLKATILEAAFQIWPLPEFDDGSFDELKFCRYLQSEVQDRLIGKSTPISGQVLFGELEAQSDSLIIGLLLRCLFSLYETDSDQYFVMSEYKIMGQIIGLFECQREISLFADINYLEVINEADRRWRIRRKKELTERFGM